MNLNTLLNSSFEDYMKGCWQHAYNKSLESPTANIIYKYMLDAPALNEALWARRYYFNKLKAYDK